METKVCNVCGEAKLVSAFYAGSKASRSKFSYACKDCSAVSTASRHAQKMLDPAYRTAWAERARAYRAKCHGWVVYELTLGDGGVYVGSTRNFRAKLGEHRRRAQNGTHHNSALWWQEVVGHRILHSCASEEEALTLERAEIARTVQQYGSECRNVKNRGGVPLHEY